MASSAFCFGRASGADTSLPETPKHRLAWLRDYRAKHPSRVLLGLAKQRAKETGVPFSITEDDIRIPKRCPALGIVLKHGTGGRRLAQSPTLDRVNPRTGYVPGNVIVISYLANAIKSNANYLQIGRVYRWLKRLTNKKKQTR